jgi:pimeloyl-ACP methyl ester carboxylesterase
VSEPARTHCRQFGHGPRAALALHCTLAHSGAWRTVGQALADRLTITAIDLPGHGRSSDWTGQGDLHRLCTDSALSVIDKPVDLIGHSFGATVALRVAVERPDMVRSLTMIEPVFFAAAQADAPDDLIAYLKDAEPYLDALEQGDMALAARRFNRLWGDGTRWDDFRETARRYMTERMHIVWDQKPALFDDNARLLSPGRMDRAAMPSLLISGSNSPSIVAAISAALAGRLPAVRQVVIPGASHMSPMTHPADVARAIGELLEVAQE